MQWLIKKMALVGAAVLVAGGIWYVVQQMKQEYLRTEKKAVIAAGNEQIAALKKLGLSEMDPHIQAVARSIAQAQQELAHGNAMLRVHRVHTLIAQTKKMIEEYKVQLAALNAKHNDLKAT
jgi:hypothetical protein